MSVEAQYEPCLKGHFLIAMPGLADPNFYKTVTFVAEHTLEGAMGVVVNRVHEELTRDAVFTELEMAFVPEVGALPLHLGGPVHTGQVFVLHGPPFGWEACRQVTPSLAMSNSTNLVKRSAQRKGPASFVLTLGYAGWGPGQGGNVGMGTLVKKVIRLTLAYNCSPFSRTMTSPISTENMTPGAHL